jgi:hypothetical protein
VSFILSSICAECRKSAHYAECYYAECLYAECFYAECFYAECYYAECYYAECFHAECYYAECRSADRKKFLEYAHFIQTSALNVESKSTSFLNNKG